VFAAVQDVHGKGPASALYVLMGHGTHGPPLGPVKPGLHLQSERSDDPHTLREFAGQCVQLHFSSMICTLRVQLVRRDGRDVSTLYGGGRGRAGW